MTTKSNKELELIKVAEQAEDSEANQAMKELRDNFDKSYFWCEDCDGLVVKKEECCLNLKTDINSPEAWEHST